MAEYKFQAYPTWAYRFNTKTGTIESRIFEIEKDLKAGGRGWKDSPDKTTPPLWWRCRQWATSKLQPNGFASTPVIAALAAAVGALIQKHGIVKLIGAGCS